MNVSSTLMAPIMVQFQGHLFFMIVLYTYYDARCGPLYKTRLHPVSYNDDGRFLWKLGISQYDNKTVQTFKVAFCYFLGDEYLCYPR